MQLQIQSVDAQVKGLQLSLNKLATKDELAAVQNNADFRIGEVEQCLDVTRQEMESRCQRMDESIHDLGDRVTSVERKQSAAVQQVTDARSDSRSVRQPVSLGVSDHIDMYHTPVGMGEFPRPVLQSTMRKVTGGPPISVSTHFTPISSMLDLGCGLGAHIHSATPAAAVDVSGGAFGSVSNGVYRSFLPAGVAPAPGVAPSVSIPTANTPCSVAHTHGAVLPTIQPGGIMAPSVSSNTTRASSADQSSRLNNSRNTSVRVKEPTEKMPSFDAETGNWTSFLQDFEDMVIEMNWEGIELNKLKVCLEGKAKQVYRSFDDSTKNSYAAVRDQFTALYGDIDERGAATAKLFHIKQRADQDLNSFVSDITVLANKAFPTDKDSAQVQAKEAFLKGCIHQSETDFVFKMGKCTTLKEAVGEVKRLVETASNKKAATVLFRHHDLTVFRATRHRLVIFQRAEGMMVSRLIEGVIVFQVRTVGTFHLTGTAEIFPVNLGAVFSHRIGGVGISRREVVGIFRPSSHALICRQAGHRDVVEICRPIIILVGIFRLTRRAIIDSLATSTNRRLAVIE